MPRWGRAGTPWWVRVKWRHSEMLEEVEVVVVEVEEHLATSMAQLTPPRKPITLL